MLVLIGPSASGKTEATKILTTKYQMEKLVTCTTRPKRPGEKEGLDYYFLDEVSFKEMISRDYFVEHISYNNYLYGTPYSAISDNKVVILESQGLKHYKEKLGSMIKVCFLRCPKDLRYQRMVKRGDSIAVIERRLHNDDDVFSDEILRLCDWIVDAGSTSIDEMTDDIYQTYQRKIAEDAD